MGDRAHLTITERLDKLPIGIFHLAMTAIPMGGLLLGSGAPPFVHQFVFAAPLLLAALIMAVLGIETRQRRLEEIAGASTARVVRSVAAFTGAGRGR